MMRVVEGRALRPAVAGALRRRGRRRAAALGDTVIRIEHVGSTSVPGLAAKPILDMMPLVQDVRDVSKRITAMAAIGYIPRGEFGLPGRRYFVKGTADARLVHCHLYAAGHPEVERHLAFRDYCARTPRHATPTPPSRSNWRSSIPPTSWRTWTARMG
jgi:GrpB-like predicted nucleotidyltransferase (UPF0157 family)